MNSKVIYDVRDDIGISQAIEESKRLTEAEKKECLMLKSLLPQISCGLIEKGK